MEILDERWEFIQTWRSIGHQQMVLDKVAKLAILYDSEQVSPPSIFLNTYYNTEFGRCNAL